MATPLRDHVIAYLELNHKIVEAGAVDLLLKDRQPLILCRAVLDVIGAGAPIITQEMVEEVVARRISPQPRLGAPRLRPGRLREERRPPPESRSRCVRRDSLHPPRTRIRCAPTVVSSKIGTAG